jgi:hypothetical protein
VAAASSGWAPTSRRIGRPGRRCLRRRAQRSGNAAAGRGGGPGDGAGGNTMELLHRAGAPRHRQRRGVGRRMGADPRRAYPHAGATARSTSRATSSSSPPWAPAPPQASSSPSTMFPSTPAPSMSGSQNGRPAEDASSAMPSPRPSTPSGHRGRPLVRSSYWRGWRRAAEVEGALLTRRDGVLTWTRCPAADVRRR